MQGPSRGRERPCWARTPQPEAVACVIPTVWLMRPQKAAQRHALPLAGLVARQLPATGRRSRTDRHHGHGLRNAGLRARVRA